MGNVTVLPPAPGSKHRPKLTDPIFDHAAIESLLLRMDSSIALLQQVASALQLNFENADLVNEDTIASIVEIQRLQRQYLDELCAKL